MRDSTAVYSDLYRRALVSSTNILSIMNWGFCTSLFAPKRTHIFSFALFQCSHSFTGENGPIKGSGPSGFCFPACVGIGKCGKHT
jgi:hypothetical protein